jgi:hypothetical protein
MVAGVAAAAGGELSRIAAPPHPSGESTVVIVRP